MSSYTGLYIQRMADGRIYNVQVVDTAGNGNALDPEVYISRGVRPPIEQLPEHSDYLAALKGPSPLIVALHGWATSEQKPTGEAIHNFERAGWIIRADDGTYELTPPGRQVLRDNGFAI